MNGFDQNWIRLCAAIDGFYVSYRKWPSRVLLCADVIEDLKVSVFSQESFAKLAATVDLVASGSPIVAQDDEGNEYSYGERGFPENRPPVSAADWLGLRPDGPGAY